MQRLIPAVVLLLGTYCTQAQSITTLSKGMPPQQRVNVIEQVARSAQKTTNTYWRVAAISNYTSNGSQLSIYDTTGYIYSNARGSSIEKNSLVMDDYGVLSLFLFDTANKYVDKGNGLQKDSRYLSDYNSKNEKTSFTEQVIVAGAYSNNTKQVVVRDNNGNITKAIILNWSSSQWDTSDVIVSTYNSMNQPLQDSSYYTGIAPQPAGMVHYFYDTGHHLIEQLNLSYNNGNWDSSYRTVQVWDNNNMVGTIYMQYNNNVWEGDTRDSMAYDTNGFLIYDMSDTWDTASGQWVHDLQLEYQVSNSGKLNVAKSSEWDTVQNTWVLHDEYEVSYDSYGNMIRIESYVYVGGTKYNVPYYVRNIYNEYYFDVHVADQTKDQQIEVYPNPATSVLHIRLSNNQLILSATLTNMNGQVVKRVNNTAGQRVDVPVRGLATGNYILTVQGEEGTARQMVTVE